MPETDNSGSSDGNTPGTNSETQTYGVPARGRLKLLTSLARCATSEPWTIVVGNLPTCFYVHSALLAREVVSFARMLQNDWEEVRTKKLDWPDEDVKVVEVMIGCLYGWNPCLQPGEDMIFLVVECYQFAERREIPSMRDKVVREFQKYFRDAHTFPDITDIVYLDNCGLESSSLREMAFDVMVWGLFHDLSAIGLQELRSGWIAVIEQDESVAYLLPSILGEFLIMARDRPSAEADPRLCDCYWDY